MATEPSKETPPPGPFRLFVVSVNEQRCEGTVLSGTLNVGDAIVIADSGQPLPFVGLQQEGVAIESATTGARVTLLLTKDVTPSIGNLLASAADRPEVADQFAALVTWQSDEPLMPGRRYLCHLGPRRVTATVTEIKYKVDPATGGHMAAKTLRAGETGLCNLSTHQQLAFDNALRVPATAAFELVDRQTNQLVGAGKIEFGLRRATNVHWQAIDVNKGARAELKSQRPAVLWFTGLSGSGKSTVANLVERRLHVLGNHTYLLDGDNVRHGLNRDLGFSDADRVENIRRVAQVAKLFVDAGMIVLVAFISPFRAERRLARELVEQNEFFEVFVDTPIDECRRRDPKGLYARADRGEIKNFTGIDSPYEPPEAAEIHLKTQQEKPEALAEAVIAALRVHGVVPSS